MPSSRRKRGGVAAVAAVVMPTALALVETAYFYILNRTHLGLGFPIDDAYIFQRYAENLARGFGFSFNPGEVSFGCTSLLWPMLMAGVFKAISFIDYVSLAFWMGGNLFAFAVFLAALSVLRSTGRPSFALLTGLALAGSPALLMNALSGMETALHLVLLLAFTAIAGEEKPRPFTAGLLAGLLAATRPEGLYFSLAGAIIWGFLRLYRRDLSFSFLVKFLLPALSLALPPYLIIYNYTSSFLPTTFLGKLLSSHPGMVERSGAERVVLAALSLADGWRRLLEPGRLFSVVVAVGIIGEAATTLSRLRRPHSPAGPLWGRMMLFGYLFLPAAYGFFFPVGPAFGGYYNRYIAPLLGVALVLGVVGLHSLSMRKDESQQKSNSFLGRLAFLLPTGGAFLLIVYLFWLYRPQLRETEQVFRNEVQLNTGLRREAAEWLADPQNVPAEARVMVGYTGLGVIGTHCGHYVLDLGALINPDIFPFYREAGMDPQARWQKIVEYMHTNNVNYYVTFALIPEYADKIADPSLTPGFHEVARLGRPEDPPLSPYDQIRIYHINWPEWKAAQKNPIPP